MSRLTHINSHGEARMVDVSNKTATARVATATGEIHMQAETLRAVLEQRHNKGDVLNTARIAAIMAAKQTAQLIPLCHPIALTDIDVVFQPRVEVGSIQCTATVRCFAVTGVEIEALLATQIALLTIYDMCKAMDRGMTLTNIGLISKSGGRSGTWEKPSDIKAASPA